MIKKGKRKYFCPLAEIFIVEEEEQLLEGSFSIGDGGEEDFGEARPIVGGATFDDSSAGEGTSHTSKSASFWEE
jgi:hypothetical protein